jgi:peroxiredoxin Q/BCP
MEMMDLSTYRGKKNVVLISIRATARPPAPSRRSASATARRIQAPRHRRSSASSSDDVLSHQAFRDEHGLTVQLLADTEKEVCRLYDVIQEKIVDGHPKSCLQRSTFVIDKKAWCATSCRT